MGVFSDMAMAYNADEDAFSNEESSAFAENAFEETVSTISQQTAAATPPQTAAKQPAVQAANAAPAAAQDDADEDTKRKAHEEAEAKRKAEWEAKQKAKKEAEALQLAKIEAMSDQELMKSSMERISTDTERLTRRNMKECISEYIQTLCLSDTDFARKAMHPRKSMIHCVWYINRKAREYVEQEMKDNDLRPDRNGIYGCDVPDDLCYQWAEEYFRDANAEEDQEKEEKFVPKPYIGKSTPSKKAAGKGKKKDNLEKKPEEKKATPTKNADSEQISFGDMGLLGAIA